MIGVSRIGRGCGCGAQHTGGTAQRETRHAPPAKGYAYMSHEWVMRGRIETHRSDLRAFRVPNKGRNAATPMCSRLRTREVEI
ncbi:hypothetical protein ABZP36_015199 [Zizania latifolia]